jgi:aryl-alcohol dehydrogenase-like predicted oxidoreductase
MWWKLSMDFSVVNKLALGSVQFGLPYGISNNAGKTPADEVERILEFCKSSELLTIDTASAYGEAEKVLGRNDLAPFQVVSKFLPNETKKAFDDQLNTTLSDLGIDQLYGYLAHRPERLIKNPWEWRLLKDKRDEGVIKKIGFSLNAPDELHHLMEQDFIPDLVQVPYNYLDRRFEEELIKLKERNIEVHTRSSFLQGLFFMKPEGLSNHFEPVKNFLKELQASGSNLQTSLLNFVLSKGFVDRVVVGVETLVQLKENIEGLKSAETLTIPIPQVPDQILMPMHWPK